MPLDKDPMLWKWQTWAFLAMLGAASGATRYLRLNRKKLGSIDYGELAADVLISTFVTNIAFIFIYSNSVSVGTAVSISGACGHVATRLLLKIDNKIINSNLTK